MRVREKVLLGGKFKFDVFKSDGKLSRTYEADNFITSTGLSYPSIFGFADCFRYLSIGSGTGANTLLGNNGWGTTGLQSGISAYSYIGGRDCNSVTEYEQEACGYREDTNEVVLTRGWRIPEGTGLFPTPITMNEFSVSPGQPAFFDGNNYICPCIQGGFEGSNLVNVFPNLCSGTAAFARALTQININSGDFLVVSYSLSINYNTGVKSFAVNINNGILNSINWTGIISGRSNLVHHGLKLISNSSPVQSAFTQLFQPEYGESYIASWGYPLEPTCPQSNLMAYISTDDLQFLVNKEKGGAMNTGAYFPYTITGRHDYSSGLMAWRSTPNADVANQFPARLKNIRTNPDAPFYPLPTDASQENTATSFGFDVNYLVAARIQHTPMVGGFNMSSRSRTGNYNCQFLNQTVTSDINQKPIRSLVLAYRDNDGATDWFPFFDMVLYNHLGKYNPSSTLNTPPTYVAPTDDTPPTGYFYMEQNGGDLTMSFQMSWSSDCPPDVIGC